MIDRVKSSFGGACYPLFFRSVGITLARMASVGSMMRPAHMNRAANPMMTQYTRFFTLALLLSLMESLSVTSPMAKGMIAQMRVIEASAPTATLVAAASIW